MSSPELKEILFKDLSRGYIRGILTSGEEVILCSDDSNEEWWVHYSEKEELLGRFVKVTL